MRYPYPHARVSEKQEGEEMRPEPSEIVQLLEKLRMIVEQISVVGQEDLSPRLAKNVQTAMIEITDKMLKVTRHLDPIKQPADVFDPSDPGLVGRFVALALLAQSRRALADISKFYGSGVYALYYKGNNKPYSPISATEHPIYVGKANPTNTAAKTPSEQGDKLTSRLNEHRRNIQKTQDDQANTLFVDDFECRFLVVQSGWESAAESYLIHLYRPIWNDQTKICYGFGKHGDDPGTRSNLRSPWDTLHPGRDWAHRDSKMKDAKSAETIRRELAEHFKSNPPLKTIDKVFKRFIDELRQT
jgi:hypothetical protein